MGVIAPLLKHRLILISFMCFPMCSGSSSNNSGNSPANNATATPTTPTTATTATTTTTTTQAFLQLFFLNSAFAQSPKSSLQCNTGYYLQGVDANGNLLCVQVPAAPTCPTTTTTTAVSKSCAAGLVFSGLDGSGNPICTQNPAFKIFGGLAVSSLTAINPSCVPGNVESVSTNCTWNASSPLTGPNSYSDPTPCRSFTSPCQAAAHNWCTSQGFFTGMVVDSGGSNPNILSVHCWSPLQ